MTLRVSIAGMMGGVVPVALAAAALRKPTELGAAAMFSGTLLALGVAALGAALLRGPARSFWLGALVFGGGYALLAFGPGSEATRGRLLTSWLIEALAERMSPSEPHAFSGARSWSVLNDGGGGSSLSIVARPGAVPNRFSVVLTSESSWHLVESAHAAMAWLAGLVGGLIGLALGRRRADRPEMTPPTADEATPRTPR